MLVESTEPENDLRVKPIVESKIGLLLETHKYFCEEVYPVM